MGSKKHKRVVEQYAAKQKKLKKDVSTLKGQLTKAEKKVTKAAEQTDRWKKEAKAHKKSASKAGARADLLQEQLDQASAALEPVPSEATVQAASVDAPVRGQEAEDGIGKPDEKWSVVQLRSEARARGLTGISRMKKSELITALK